MSYSLYNTQGPYEMSRFPDQWQPQYNGTHTPSLPGQYSTGLHFVQVCSLFILRIQDALFLELDNALADVTFSSGVLDEGWDCAESTSAQATPS